MKEKDSHLRLTQLDSIVPGVPDPRGGFISPEIRKRAVNPPFLGEVRAPDGYAYLWGECGDSMEVFLAIRGGRVQRARFDTLGCGFTVACGSMAMELAEGRSVIESLRIDADRIAEALGGLPDSHVHCAELAAETLKKAVLDYLRRRKDPWRNPYRGR